MEYSVKEFNDDMLRIIRLLEENKDPEARSAFNREIYPKYATVRGSDVDNPISRLILFFYDLDEFLNDANARLLGVSDRAAIIRSFYSDYEENLTRALVQERKGQGPDLTQS